MTKFLKTATIGVNNLRTHLGKKYGVNWFTFSLKTNEECTQNRIPLNVHVYEVGFHGIYIFKCLQHSAYTAIDISAYCLGFLTKQTENSFSFRDSLYFGTLFAAMRIYQLMCISNL